MYSRDVEWIVKFNLLELSDRQEKSDLYWACKDIASNLEVFTPLLGIQKMSQLSFFRGRYRLKLDILLGKYFFFLVLSEDDDLDVHSLDPANQNLQSETS